MTLHSALLAYSTHSPAAHITTLAVLNKLTYIAVKYMCVCTIVTVQQLITRTCDVHTR